MSKVGVKYDPDPIVEDFIQDYIPEELFYSFIVGPVGSGKTTGNIMKIAYMAGLQEPGPDGIRRTRAVVVRNTANQLVDTTIPSFFTWFKDGVAGTWRATPKTFILKYGDVECEILFRALDNPDDVSRVLSLEVTFAVLDEFVQIEPEIVEALSGRCGRYPSKKDGGATNFGMWGASNPGEEETWWHDKLVVNRPRTFAYFHQPSGTSPYAENLENLPPGYYDNLAEGKSESWIMQYIHAEWGFSVAGRPVVTSFNRKLHVADAPLRVQDHLDLVIGYDPGRISALIFGQMDMYGRLLVLQDMVLEGYGTERMVSDRLKPLLMSKYRGLETILAPDPAGEQTAQKDEGSVVKTLKEARFKNLWKVSVDNTNLLTPRLEAVDYFVTRITPKGPAMVIDPSCRDLIRALQSGWRYEKMRSGEQKPKPAKNKSSHPGDALTYLCRYYHRDELRERQRQHAPRMPTRQFKKLYSAR